MLGLAKATQAGAELPMLPNWIVVLSAIELTGFLAMALGIVTAVPEAAAIRAHAEPNLEKTR